jgi:hypothetical protein
MNQFGRLIPKDRSYETKYPFGKLMGVSGTVKSVERTLTIPLGLRSFYDQKDNNACTGFSASWMMSIYNCVPQQKYDALWLYHAGQINDGDPYTDPASDNGGYVWAVFWALQHLGHKKMREANPDIRDGIISYYWARSADDVRAAIAIGRPVVIGVNWYEEFMSPQYIRGEYWIGKHPDLRKSLGGHAICIYGASDKRQAFRLINTWGLVYPQVWLPYKIFDRLMSEDGEAVAAIDNPKVT